MFRFKFLNLFALVFKNFQNKRINVIPNANTGANTSAANELNTKLINDCPTKESGYTKFIRKGSTFLDNFWIHQSIMDKNMTKEKDDETKGGAITQKTTREQKTKTDKRTKEQSKVRIAVTNKSTVQQRPPPLSVTAASLKPLFSRSGRQALREFNKFKVTKNFQTVVNKHLPNFVIDSNVNFMPLDQYNLMINMYESELINMKPSYHGYTCIMNGTPIDILKRLADYHLGLLTTESNIPRWDKAEAITAFNIANPVRSNIVTQLCANERKIFRPDNNDCGLYIKNMKYGKDSKVYIAKNNDGNDDDWFANGKKSEESQMLVTKVMGDVRMLTDLNENFMTSQERVILSAIIRDRRSISAFKEVCLRSGVLSAEELFNVENKVMAQVEEIVYTGKPLNEIELLKISTELYKKYLLEKVGEISAFNKAFDLNTIFNK